LIGNYDPANIDQVSMQRDLGKKGFIVKFVNDEINFVQEINSNGDSYSSIWLIPNSSPSTYSYSMLVSYVKSGKSVFIWGDNTPYFSQSNNFFASYFGNKEYQLTGNNPGQQELKSGDGIKTKTFSKFHPLSKGFVKLYEGFTICYWSRAFPGFEVFAKQSISTMDVPVIWYKEMTAVEGRILVDCGFTKLYKGAQFYTPDVSRYISNAACWLANLENNPDSAN